MLWATSTAAFADQTYQTEGEDVYRVGQSATASHVVYEGSQTLTIERQGKAVRYDAQARYARHDAIGKSTANARFVQQLMANGSFEDQLDQDPDFLTVLNQPFAVQLDPVTMRDLRGLHRAVPFNATSPLGGDAVLRGYLRPGIGGSVAGRPAAAVRFEATGPMSGPLPGVTHGTMSGSMHMDGTAYYALDDAMLLALDATLTIDAQLSEGSQKVPVRITYRRYIRAQPKGLAKTPQPAPLPTDAGTGSPPTR